MCSFSISPGNGSYISVSRHREEINDHFGQLFGTIFLKEMAPSLNSSMRLAVGSGYSLLEYALASEGNWITIAENDQKRFIKPGQHLPRLAVRW